MEISRNTKFITAIVLQVVIVLTIILFKVAVIGGGMDVLLRIQPVDPRDPLRGDYVTFQYEISSIDPYLLGNEIIKKGDTVYVPLLKGGKYWFAQRFVQKNKPSGEQLFIKGVVISGGSPASPTPQRKTEDGSVALPITPPIGSQNTRIRVSYGIEEYFIPEGTGVGFSFWRRESYARVTINDKGDAVLREIFIDDKPWP